MVGIKSIVMSGVVMASALVVSSAVAQCNSDWGNHVHGCGHQNARICGVGGGFAADYREQWDRFKADYNLTSARNAAWPQPFKCRDRALTYQFFQTNIDAGWEYAYTLTSIHFDTESNELNRAGEAKVAWIMQTSPQHRRSIFVYQEDSDSIDYRIASVKETVNRWYGHLGVASIAATNTLPQGGDGTYFQTINELYLDSRPIPALNASIGGAIGEQ